MGGAAHRSRPPDQTAHCHAHCALAGPQPRLPRSSAAPSFLPSRSIWRALRLNAQAHPGTVPSASRLVSDVSLGRPVRSVHSASCEGPSQPLLAAPSGGPRLSRFAEPSDIGRVIESLLYVKRHYAVTPQISESQPRRESAQSPLTKAYKAANTPWYVRTQPSARITNGALFCDIIRHLHTSGGASRDCCPAACATARSSLTASRSHALSHTWLRLACASASTPN